MKKAVLFVPALLLALAATAFAQNVDKGKDRAETVKITVSGSWDLDFIYRERALKQFRGGGLQDDESEFAPSTWIRLDVELTDKVSAVMEIGLDALANLGNQGINPEFGQLYAQLAEAFDPAITIRFGQIWVDFDIRGKGSSIVLDSFWSENISLSQSADGRSVADYGFSAGATVEYKRDAISLMVALLPKINDGSDPSAPSDDESIYAIMFTYNLDSVGKGSRIGLMFSSFGTAGNETGILTVGGGADIHGLIDGLELALEVFFQFGDAGSAGAPVGTIDAGGLAFQFAARYTFSMDSKPWVELKITWLSGDDTADDENENFISREHVRDLMIIEDEVFGVDWDTNMMAIKLMGGISFSVGSTPNNLHLGLVVGICTANEDVGPVATAEDGIGNEVDLKVTWNYSKAVNVNVGLAFLFGSDIMELAGAPLSAQEDSTWLFTVGADAKW